MESSTIKFRSLSIVTVVVIVILLFISQFSSAVVVKVSGSEVEVLDHRTADFGPKSGEYNVEGSLQRAYTPQGCDAPPTPYYYSNNIVLLLRGNCTFVDKVLIAQSHGALGVIVGNTPDELQTFVTMVLTPDHQAAEFTVPSVFVTSASYLYLNFVVDMNQEQSVVKAVLDKRGEYTIYPRNSSETVSVKSLVRLMIVVAASFPIMWIFWVCTLICTRCLHGAIERGRRRHRLGMIPSVEYDAKYSHEKNDPEFVHNSSCVICMDDFVQGQQVKRLGCSHAFCESCIELWISERSDLCPICKRSVLESSLHGDSFLSGCIQRCVSSCSCLSCLRQRMLRRSRRRLDGEVYSGVQGSGSDDAVHSTGMMDNSEVSPTASASAMRQKMKEINRGTDVALEEQRGSTTISTTAESNI